MVVDIGHTRDADCVNPFIKKERAREVMKVSGDRLFHLHLHDFTDTDHHPPFDGNVQWKEIFMALQDLEYKGEYMFEVAPRFPLADTIRKTAAFPDEFMKRYED
jgi:sugar phosphate isomerase/epimerase